MRGGRIYENFRDVVKYSELWNFGINWSYHCEDRYKAIWQSQKEVGRMLVEPFRQNILPILVQIGMVMVIYNVTVLGYSQIRRPDVAQMVEKLRGLLFGFLLVKCSYLAVMFINNTVDKIVIK